jgi:endonuclease/exonuclease/phosphatase (EEP) superfamily protein YafD
MRRARTMLGNAGLILAAVCALLAVLAQGGRFSPWLDVLTHLAPLLLGGAMIGGLVAVATPGGRRTSSLVLAAIGILCSALLIAPEFLRSAGPTAAPGAPGEIKVVQFNVLRDNRNLKGIVDWLQAENPDFAILEEVTPALRDLLQKRTGWAVAGYGTTAMIFSHDRYVVMNRPKDAPNSDLTWVNATYANPTGSIEVVVTHTTWPTRAMQASQSADLVYVTHKLSRPRMILAGDFNSTPWSFRRRRDDDAFGLIRRDRAVPTWPTDRVALWPSPIPFALMPIDHIYAGSAWATTSVRRGPRLGSDHYPLIVTLAPVAQP